MAQVADYSGARPGGAALAAYGFQGVMRYLSRGSANDWKILTTAEAHDLWDHGLAIGLVWETTAGRALEGFDAGRVDAAEARSRLAGSPFPADFPIVYAVDTDVATPNAVAPYFEGVIAASPPPSAVWGETWGVYGEYDVIEWFAGRTPWLWQCAAWSGFGQGSGGSIDGRRLSAHACLFQRANQIWNGQVDLNDVLGRWPGYHPDQPLPETDMPLTDNEIDRIAATSAKKVMEVLTGRAQVEQQEWAFADVAKTQPYPTWQEVIGVINLGTAATGIKVIEAVKGGDPAPADVEAVAKATADELAERLKV